MNDIQIEAADRAEKLKRCETLERAEADKRARAIAENDARTAGVNAKFFAAEAERATQAAANKSISLKPQSNAEAIAVEQARLNRPAINPPQEGFLDAHSLVPAPRKPSIVLQTQPSKYPSGDPRAGLTEALILSFNMDPDPTHPPFAKK
jgi:hypothetical protein